MKRLFNTTNFLVFQVLISFVALYFVNINNDVAWHLQVAKSILSGKTLYEDVVEINLPFVYYFRTIAVSIAGAAGISAMAASKIVVAGVSCLSIVLLSKGLDKNNALHQTLIISFAFIALVLPLGMRINQFGQKEHLFIIAVIPYTIMRLLAREGQASSKIYDIATIVAAIGFCIKPFYILWLIALELMKLKSFYSKSYLYVLRRENMILGSVFILYLLFMVLVTPNYFQEVIPLLSRFYYYYRMPADVFLFLKVLSHMALYAIPLVMLFPFVSKPYKGLYWLLLTSIMVATIQLKGWQYHFFPAMSCAILISSIGLYHCFKQLRDAYNGNTSLFVFILLGLVVGFLTIPMTRNYFFVIERSTFYLIIAGIIVSYLLYQDITKKKPTKETKKKVKNPAKYMIDSISLSGSNTNIDPSKKAAEKPDEDNTKKPLEDVDKKEKTNATISANAAHKAAPNKKILKAIKDSYVLPARAQLFSAAFFIGAMLYITVNGMHNSITNINSRNIYQIDTLVPYLQEHSDNKPVVILSEKLVHAFPTINYAHQGWGLSFSSLWLLTGVENYKTKFPKHIRNERLLSDAETFLIDRISSDIMTSNPSLILEDVEQGLSLHWHGKRIPYIPYFARNEEFKSFFNDNYALKEFIRDHRGYRRFAVYAKKDDIT